MLCCLKGEEDRYGFLFHGVYQDWDFIIIIVINDLVEGRGEHQFLFDQLAVATEVQARADLYTQPPPPSSLAALCRTRAQDSFYSRYPNESDRVWTTVSLQHPYVELTAFRYFFFCLLDLAVTTQTPPPPPRFD